ncbi:MAG: hypothetical protein JW925_06935 [Syntrophaceae bacterium]|nr:hypothetical protein [Syntrophaceae bacterium]
MKEGAEYQILVSVNDGILEIIQTGEVIDRTIRALANEIIDIIKTNGFENVLIDIRAIKGRFSNSEFEYRVRNYTLDKPQRHIAVVDLLANTDYQPFRETTTINTNRSFRWFTDIDAARAWLKSNANS